MFGCPAWEFDAQIRETNEPRGLCRFNSPQVGEPLESDDGETVRDFGLWPRVLWDDWCGKFELRQKEPAEGFS